MILANYAQQNRNCVREWGKAFTNPFSQFKPQVFCNYWTPDDTAIESDYSSFSHGYNTSAAWWQAKSSGGLASGYGTIGSGTISADALAVKLAEAALSGDGTLTAVGGLIVQLIASVAGDGTISSANLQAFLTAAANLTGSGSITANRTALGALIAALTGSGDADGSTVTATGALDADITVTGTGLTTANVGPAVWASIAAANNTPGTMGEKLNDAGSAANPWTEALPGAYVAGTAGYILGNIPASIAAVPDDVWAKVIEAGFTAEEIIKILLAVAAGDATGMQGPATVFKSQDGTTNRIEATQDGDTRVINTIDVT